MRQVDPERKEIIQAEYKKLMLQAAERVIMRRGFRLATMDEIAREARFSKATLYKYFKSKGEILLEIILQYFEEIRARVVEIQRSAEKPEEKIKLLIESILEIQSQKENISRMFLQDKSLRDFIHRFFMPTKKDDNREFQQALRSFRLKRQDIFEAGCQVIKEGIEKERFVRTSPESILNYIWAVIEGLVHTRYWREKKVPVKEETEEVYRFLMTGIARQAFPEGEEK